MSGESKDSGRAMHGVKLAKHVRGAKRYVVDVAPAPRIARFTRFRISGIL